MGPLSWDVAVAGGGPAGLAFGTCAARLGMKVVVVERDALPRDKACGEGLLPAGLAELDALGARELLGASDATPFGALRYVQENGRWIEAALPAPGGLGIRRTALSRALQECAQSSGATLWVNERVLEIQRDAGAVTLRTSKRELTAGAVVVADGLHSPLRRALGWQGAPAKVERFGLRRHARVTWPARVEVHFAPGVEAYLTPSGAGRTGIAFLFEPKLLGEKASFGALLARFPALEEAFAGADFDSEAMGAGPLHQRATRLVGDRIALLGDAAGYVDALTGEGLSLGFVGARVLAQALASEPVDEALRRYEREARRAFSRYARLTHGIMAMARRPVLRRAALSALSLAPPAFEALVRVALPTAHVEASEPASRDPLSEPSPADERPR